MLQKMYSSLRNKYYFKADQLSQSSINWPSSTKPAKISHKKFRRKKPAQKHDKEIDCQGNDSLEVGGLNEPEDSQL